MNYIDEDALRIKILSNLRDFEVRKANDQSLRRSSPSIGKMAEAVECDFGTVERVCSELEEEGLVKYTTRKTTGWTLDRRKDRRFAITADGRSYLKNHGTATDIATSNIHAEGDVNINVASEGSHISTGDTSNHTSEVNNITDSSNVAIGDGNAIASTTETPAAESKSPWLSRGVIAGLVTAAIVGIVTWYFGS